MHSISSFTRLLGATCYVATVMIGDTHSDIPADFFKARSSVADDDQGIAATLQEADALLKPDFSELEEPFPVKLGTYQDQESKKEQPKLPAEKAVSYKDGRINVELASQSNFDANAFQQDGSTSFLEQNPEIKREQPTTRTQSERSFVGSQASTLPPTSLIMEGASRSHEQASTLPPTSLIMEGAGSSHKQASTLPPTSLIMKGASRRDMQASTLPSTSLIKEGASRRHEQQLDDGLGKFLSSQHTDDSDLESQLEAYVQSAAESSAQALPHMSSALSMPVPPPPALTTQENAIAAPTQQACTPQCTWKCDSPKCSEVCTPRCQSPVCQTRCQGYDLTGCKLECNKPQCAVICPGQACATANCPTCTTRCSEPVCALKCPARQPCKNICENPRCEWNCTAPMHCPKPTCHMECQTPRNCMGSTYKQLPPLMPGESAVQSFTAPVDGQSLPSSLLQKAVKPRFLHKHSLHGTFMLNGHKGTHVMSVPVQSLDPSEDINAKPVVQHQEFQIR